MRNLRSLVNLLYKLPSNITISKLTLDRIFSVKKILYRFRLDG